MKRLFHLIAKHRLLALLITALWATGMHAQRTFKAMINGQETDVKCVKLWKHGPYFAEMNIGASSPFEFGTMINYYDGPYCETEEPSDLDDFVNCISIQGTEYDPARKMWGDGWQVPDYWDINYMGVWCDIERPEVTGQDQYITIRGRDEYADRVLYVPFRGQVTQVNEGGGSSGKPLVYGELFTNLIGKKPIMFAWHALNNILVGHATYLSDYALSRQLFVRAVVRVDHTELRNLRELAEQLEKELDEKPWSDVRGSSTMSGKLWKVLLDTRETEAYNDIDEEEVAIENLKNVIKEAQNFMNEVNGGNTTDPDDNPGGSDGGNTGGGTDGGNTGGGSDGGNTGGGGSTEPTDSIGGGSGEIITPTDSIGGDIDPVDPDVTEVNSEAYRKMYLDYLNYYYNNVRNHHIATWLYNYVERECDRLDDKFENQEACDNLYAYLLEKFNIIREMVGDTPYNGTSYKPQNFKTDKLDALAIHAEAYYDKIHVSHTGPAYNLSDALRDALLATYEIKTQADIENIYAKLLEEYNDVRRRCGDKPYGEEDDEEPDSDNPDYANLNSAIRRSGWFIDDLKADSKYAGIMGELQTALDEAKEALDSKKQSAIDAAAQKLEDALLKAQNDKKEMDKQPDVAEEEGTPMSPIAPDLNRYTHKMMVHGSPWGINGLNMIMMRDKKGRLVQTMTVQARNGGLEEIITDSVRTYIYDDYKMTEKLAVPEYDSNDNLTLIPMSRKETSYYRLADGGHREVCVELREEDGVYTPMRKTVTVFDAQGRKVSLKHYALWSGEQLEYYYDYTYDEDGGFYTKGKNDWGENVHTYTCYDQNGNQTYKTDYMGLYIYSWDEQNHAQGYTLYRNYNVEDNTCTAIDESRQYKITETYDDGRTKSMKTSTGNTKTYVYADNQETETVSEDGYTTTYVRTFDADGRLLKMEKNGTALISEFAWSNIDADKVLGGVSTVDENMRWQISKGTTYWTSDKSLLSARRSFIFEGFKEDQTTTYNIVPLSLLPAESTENGITIPVGFEGDEVVMEAGGEIYLMDKGGKKRYSCKVGDSTVSVEGGKIVITGWTPIGGGASDARRKAQVRMDLEDGEYSIYIPENVVKVNDEPMSEMFTAINVDTEEDGIASIKVGPAKDDRIYNLQGMTVKNPAKGQIIIIGGRKVLR